VRYIGVSNHNSEQIGEAARICEALGLNKFISSQPYYNMLGATSKKRMSRAVCRKVWDLSLFAACAGPVVG
jgi:aryl-alcohol dehydrogenase-like predicted oxidoreductase